MSNFGDEDLIISEENHNELNIVINYSDENGMTKFENYDTANTKSEVFVLIVFEVSVKLFKMEKDISENIVINKTTKDYINLHLVDLKFLEQHAFDGILL